MSDIDPIQLYPNLNYEKPSWSSNNQTLTKLEVLKNGLHLEDFQLPSDKQFLVIGRLPTCDLSLEHQSVSRYHAIIQFDAKGGSFVYDLNSTHGTFLNKQRVTSKVYQPLKDGDMLIFGESTRIFLVCKRMNVPFTDREQTEIDNGGVNWGFKEDAYEPEQVNSLDQENVSDYHTESENDGKHKYYYADPKKALRTFMENKGYDLQFETSEEGRSHERIYTVRVQLPDEFRASVYEKLFGTGSANRKREAERLAALDACIKLDKLGELNPSSSTNLDKELSARGRDRNGYSSEEDDFYDRTKLGSRNKKVKQTETEVETYDSLLVKRNGLLDQIEELKNKISEETADALASGEDAIDAIVQQLKLEEQLKERTNIQVKVKELELDLKKIEYLLELTKPHESILEIRDRRKGLKEDESKSKLVNEPENETETEAQNKVSNYDLDQTEKNLQKNDIYKPTLPTVPPQLQKDLEHDEPTIETTNRTDSATDSKEQEMEEWVPPKDQTGDGKTFLNDRFGY